MFNESHDLAAEFPEYKDAIHQLKTSDAHFAKLFAAYNEVDDKLLHISQEIETTSDEVTETLKKQRLQLKDELIAMLKKSKAA